MQASSYIQQFQEIISKVKDPYIKSHPQSWSVIEVLGHLLDSANNNHQRFVRARSGKCMEFPAYQPNEFVESGKYQSYQYYSLVKLVLEYNLLLSHLTQNLKSDILQTKVKVGEGEPHSVEWLVEDYWSHFKLHLNQLERIIKADVNK